MALHGRTGPELLDRLSTEAKAYQLATLPAGHGNEERRARMADPANHLLHHARHWSSSRPSSPRPGSRGLRPCRQNLMLAAGAWSRQLLDRQCPVLPEHPEASASRPAEGCVPAAPIIVGYPASQLSQSRATSPLSAGLVRGGVRLHCSQTATTRPERPRLGPDAMKPWWRSAGDRS